MSIRRITLGVVAVIAAVAPASLASADGQSDDAPPYDPAHAIYGDKVINLAKDWEGAGACIELGTVTRCYDTQDELVAAHPEVFGAAAGRDAGASSLLLCSGVTSLHTNTSYGGFHINYTTVNTFHNLSAVGFDNTTSSYQITGCDAEFWEGASGGGASYPGNTSAGASATSMAAGWDNRVSSVWIYG